MNKRGELQIYYIIELVIGILVVSIMMRAGYNYATGTHDQKSYLATDLALTATSLGTFPGNIDYYYPLYDYPFYYSFEDTLVSIRDGLGGLRPQQKHFITTTKSNLDIHFDNPVGIVMSKQGGKLFVREAHELTANWYTSDCEGIPFKTISPLVIDPGNGGDDTGFVKGDLQESVIVRELAQVIQSEIPSAGTTRSLDGEQTRTLQQRKLSLIFPEAGFISLHIGNYSNQENYLKFYVNANGKRFSESKKLACLLQNTLSQLYPRKITGVAIIPLDPSLLKDTDEKKILDSETVGVFVELGNINFAQNSFLNASNRREVGKSLAHTIKMALQGESSDIQTAQQIQIST